MHRPSPPAEPFSLPPPLKSEKINNLYFLVLPCSASKRSVDCGRCWMWNEAMASDGGSSSFRGLYGNIHTPAVLTGTAFAVVGLSLSSSRSGSSCSTSDRTATQQWEMASVPAVPLLHVPQRPASRSPRRQQPAMPRTKTRKKRSGDGFLNMDNYSSFGEFVGLPRPFRRLSIFFRVIVKL